MDYFFNEMNTGMNRGMNTETDAEINREMDTDTGMNTGRSTGRSQRADGGMNGGMNPERNQGMNGGMNPEWNRGMNGGMNPEWNRGMNGGMNPEWNQGMNGEMIREPDSEMDFGTNRRVIPGMNTGMNWGMNPSGGSRFASVTGIIVELMPARMGNRRVNGCVIFASLEDEDGNLVNFIVTPQTFVVGWETLSVGMRTTFWYRTDAPAPLIYPPQYNAVVAAQEKSGRMVNVDFYNNSLLNAAQNLQLNIDGSVDIRTTNNQYFQGSPAGHNLVVVYETSTRSIPAQTTPKEIIVLCDR